MKNAILIVDDSRLNRETLADILKDKYNIIEAEDGRSGLEVLEKRKDDIVLVILDIVMPGMDGFAFMEEARTRESIRNIPIVVATTENDYQTEKRCLELGFYSKSFPAGDHPFPCAEHDQTEYGTFAGT